VNKNTRSFMFSSSDSPDRTLSHELKRCSTCKRSSARDLLHFTLCDKTCDACCLKKRKYRFYTRKTAPLREDDERKRRLTANESRKCSTCKCWKKIECFESMFRKTCVQCLQSRQLARHRAKYTESNYADVESPQVFGERGCEVNNSLLNRMVVLRFEEKILPEALQLFGSYQTTHLTPHSVYASWPDLPDLTS